LNCDPWTEIFLPLPLVFLGLQMYNTGLVRLKKKSENLRQGKSMKTKNKMNSELSGGKKKKFKTR
jgi:hypothetical protein